MVSAARRARDDVARLAARALDIRGYFDEAGRVLRRAVPFDGFCSMTVDPATMLLTSHIAHDSVRPEDVGLLARNEFLEEDVNTFRVLACAVPPAGSLRVATGGEPEQSARFRGILAPNGITDELRLALVEDGACWGWVALYRRVPSPAFAREEVELLGALSRPLAQGLRRSILLSSAAEDDSTDAPGVVLLARDGSVEAVTPAAERWLERMRPRGTDPHALPTVVHAVASAALQAARDGKGEGPCSRVPVPEGPWLMVHGSVIGDSGEGRTAVIIEPAQPPEVAPVIVAAYGLTPRERQVAQHVLHGLSTAQIADALHISPYTVQDHLTSVFEKVGVRSRRELVATVFFQHYVPRIEQGLPIGPRGWFHETPASPVPDPG